MSLKRTTEARTPWRRVLEDLRLHPTDEAAIWAAVCHQLAEHVWDGPSMVYLMQSGRWVKIGQTMQRIEVRRREIARSTGRAVLVMACLSASTSLETSLHAIFAPWHVDAVAGDEVPSSVRAPSGVEWFERTDMMDRLARTMNAMQAIVGRPVDSPIWVPEEGDVEAARALLGHQNAPE